MAMDSSVCMATFAFAEKGPCYVIVHVREVTMFTKNVLSEAVITKIIFKANFRNKIFFITSPDP